jgi:transcriptional regulator with XRE-family HTH domain
LEVSIGTKLKALRLQAGLTQVQLAQACGVQQSVLTRYENDLKTPSAPRLAAVARALGVTVEEILDQTPLPEASEPRLHVHGNSREAKVQELFRKLDEETQRVVLKQMKALADAKPTTEHKRHKAA